MSEDVAKCISYYFMKVSNEQIQCCVCGACFDSGQHGIYVTHLKSRHNKIFQGIKKEESNKGLTKKSNEDKHPQYVGTWFPSFQGHPLISGAMPLESGAGFA